MHQSRTRSGTALCKALQACLRTLGLVFVLTSSAAYAAEVVIGQVCPLSGLDANQGRAYAAGMQIHFNAINKSGGINGHTFTLIQKDDGGRAEDTVRLTRQLLAQDRPLLLAGYFGTRNLDELLAAGILEANRVVLVGYRSTEIRPEAPRLYNVRASMADEIDKITEHVATIGITRLGLLYEAGPGSAALISAADAAAERAKVRTVARASYSPGTTDVSPAVNTFIEKAPQAIVIVAGAATTAAFIEKYRAAGGAAQLFAHSGADIEQLSKRLGEDQLRGVAIAQVTPNPYRMSSRLAKEFTETLGANSNVGLTASYAMIEGYITAGVIAEAVRRQPGTPTREGMVAALERIRNLDLGGYVVDFKPGQHSGSRFVELSIVDGVGKIRQ